jgi:hypothetical protein
VRSGGICPFYRAVDPPAKLTGMEQQIGETPTQPWGADPPPAPPTATRAQLRKVRAAWSSWSHFRPWYTREGDVVEAEINLKDHIWRGVGTAPTEAEAAWRALPDCIDNWTADVAIPRLPRSVREWLRRRRTGRRAR